MKKDFGNQHSCVANTARRSLVVFAGLLCIIFSYLFSPSTASAALTTGLTALWTFDGRGIMQD